MLPETIEIKGKEYELNVREIKGHRGIIYVVSYENNNKKLVIYMGEDIRTVKTKMLNYITGRFDVTL